MSRSTVRALPAVLPNSLRAQAHRVREGGMPV